MVFHGDYEVEFEIYRKQPDDWRTEYLGHMPAMTAQEAKTRWVEKNGLTPEEETGIVVLYPLEE